MDDVTVVVPVKNEEKTILPLLESLEHLEQRPSEVVIVDGGSSDRTVEVIRTYLRSKSLSYPIKLIETLGAFPGKGRNLGIRNSNSPVIACTDAGGRVDPKWLGELAAPFGRSRETDLVIGRCESNASGLFEEMSFFLFLKNIRRKSVIYSGCASLAFRRRLWEKAGGFPENLYPCEDKYFLIKARQKARQIEEVPSACVYWSPRQNPLGFMKQYFLYGRGDGRIHLAKIYHMARFLAYGAGILLVLLGSAFVKGWVGLALVVYLGEVSLRAFGQIRNGIVFLCVPLLLLAKDLSQMAGFLVGWIEGLFSPTFRLMRSALGPRRDDAAD